MKKRLVACALMCTAGLMFGGCGSDNTNTPFIKEVESIAIDAVAVASVEDFEGLQLACTVFYDDNTSAVATQRVTWSASDPSVAHVSNGLVELASSAGGEVNVTASYEHFSDYVTVNVFALSDINVSISGGDANVSANSLYQMTAMGTFTDTLLDVNNSAIDITADVAWSSDDQTVATVDAAGELTTLGIDGSAEIMAKVFDINGTIDVNVSL